ncbi:hypothetical protein BS78_07G102800 [Paspalum vaginatum]|nr:hypothetical protein BS78_07G102800 [Paspalum vaginatum]
MAAAIEMGGSLQFYSGGIFSWQCRMQMNHVIIIIGYGTDGSTGLKYWMVSRRCRAGRVFFMRTSMG